MLISRTQIKKYRKKPGRLGYHNLEHWEGVLETRFWLFGIPILTIEKLTEIKDL